MKKKLMCLMMGAMLVISSFPAMAYADTIDPSNLELSMDCVKEMLTESDISKSTIASESEVIVNEVEILDAFGYDTNTISGAEMENGEVIYSIEASGTGASGDIIEAEVAVEEAADGTISMSFTEDSQEATLVFTNDGKIFIDGDEIVITEGGNPTLEGSAIYRTSTVPFGCGSASKYTHYGGPRNWNIKFNNFICVTLITVCAAVIVTAMTGNLKAAAALATSESIIGYASLTDGKALSAISKMYYHTDYDQFMISSSQGCRKELTDFYSTGNYAQKMNVTPLISYYYFMMPGC